MWEAFHGRSAAYATALEAPDDAALAEALRRNVWRGAEVPAEDAPLRLAAIVRTCVAALARQDIAALARGTVIFPEASA